MIYLRGKLVDKLLASDRGYTSYILKEDTIVGKVKILYNRGTRRVLREYLIYFKLLLELLSLKSSRLRDFDHDTRIDLVYERDTSTPNPVDSGILALDIYSEI